MITHVPVRTHDTALNTLEDEKATDSPKVGTITFDSSNTLLELRQISPTRMFANLCPFITQHVKRLSCGMSFVNWTAAAVSIQQQEDKVCRLEGRQPDVVNMWVPDEIPQ